MKRFVLFVALAAVACGAAAPSAKRSATVRPGVAIGGLSLGGLSSEQARNAISWWYNRPLRFVFYGKHWTVRPTALGAGVDADDAVRQVLQASPADHLSLRVDVDQARVQRYVRQLDGQLAVAPTDATASLDGLQPVIQRGKPGITLDRERTAERITAALAIARRSGVL